jgi:ElaB/YqjD/DUF883 family membrane-anchored ribosome-binding protein
MGQTADQLREEVDQKREDAAQKIEQIQAKVEGATQQVKDTVEDAKQQVKDTFDLRKQIEEKPLVALGAALVGGFVLGGMMSGDDDRGGHHHYYGGSQRSDPGATVSYSANTNASPGVKQHLRSAVKSSGIEDTLNEMVSSFMGQLGERVRAVSQESLGSILGQQGGGQQGGGQ